MRFIQINHWKGRDMNKFNDLGVQIPTILLPNQSLDYLKWAVIACDQYTSQPEYWKEVEEFVGEAPSTLKMILPEVYLETEDELKRIEKTKTTMDEYLQQGLFKEFQGFILVERNVAGRTRHGIVLTLDLEKYDFSKGSQTLIRATEGTIIDRLPPRIRIREGAKLEFPHILVLIDDPNKSVIEPFVFKKEDLNKLYDFELMKNSGHLRGYAIQSDEDLAQIGEALAKLANPDQFRRNYNLNEDLGVLLFAMGDGNHSLATAKSIWEKMKPNVGMDHPARYALVEIENIHDAGLEFEPIHRVLFDLKEDIVKKMHQFWENQIEIASCDDANEMIDKVDQQNGNTHKFGLVINNSYNVIEVQQPTSNLPVGTLQSFLDQFIKSGGAEKIDYVHGSDVTCKLGAKPGNCGFYLPAMEKNQLFRTVILDGALPRKTFSMGEAYEKRFYMEGRKITK